MPGTFAEDIAGYADGGCRTVEVWLTKLENHLLSATTADTLTLLKDRGVTLAAAAYQGGLLLSQGEQRKAHFDHFRRRLDLCQSFGIPTMIILADFAQKLEPTTLERAIVSLTQAAQWAEAYSVRLALEFRGSDTFCNCLDTAITMVESVAQPNVGVCLDLFHYYKGPSKPEDLDRLSAANLAHVQVCDVAGVPRELMTDSDRVFPGEGDFHLQPIFERLRHIGYSGPVSVEVLNPILWQSKSSQVAELAMTSLARFLN